MIIVCTICYILVQRYKNRLPCFTNSEVQPPEDALHQEDVAISTIPSDPDNSTESTQLVTPNCQENSQIIYELVQNKGLLREVATKLEKDTNV